MINFNKIFFLISLVFVIVLTGCATTEDNLKEVNDNNTNKIEFEESNNDDIDNTNENEIETNESNSEETESEKAVETDKESTKAKNEVKPENNSKNTKKKQEESTVSTNKTKDQNTVTSKKEKQSTTDTKRDSKEKEKPKEKPKEEQKKETPVVEKKDTVTLSVRVQSGVSGPNYGPQKIEIIEGDSVFDILNKTGLDINSTGRGISVYVRGISGLKEFDEGPMSGWKYKVDGVFPGESAGSFKMKNGQQIEWVYTVDWTEE